MLSIGEGRELVKLARSTVEMYAGSEGREFGLQKSSSKTLLQKCGVFVTILSYPGKELRGCIGYTSPMTLRVAAQMAAYAAAFEDGRFSPVGKDELDRVVFEVSVLGEPQQIKCKPEEYANAIEAGKDGVIIKSGGSSGLFLPQVWEQLPDKERFLEELCHKAGLTSDFLFDEGTSLYKFRVQAFHELNPNGKIIESVS